MLQGLLSVGDKVPALLSITGNGGTGHRQLQAKFQLDGGIDNGVKAKDLLLSIRVLRISAHPDSGIHIRRELGAAKEERVGKGIIVQDDFGEHSSLDHQIETGPLELFSESEDLVEDTGPIELSLLKTKGEDFHLGPW